MQADDLAVGAKDREDLGTLSTDLLAKWLLLVLRKQGLSPKEVELALESEGSMAVRPGAKPPITEFGAGPTAGSSLPTRSSAASIPRRYQSIAPAQPSSPTTLEQAITPYKNRPHSTVLNSSTRPVEKALTRVAAEVPSLRVAAEALEE